MSDVRVPEFESRVSRMHDAPLYRQIAAELLDGIRSGRWPAGSKLPPESELVQTFQASRLTVRKSVELLVRDGLLSRQPGRGTFVLSPVITGGPRFFGSFTEELAHRGIRAGSTVLRQEVVPATGEVRHQLGLEDGDPVIFVERIRHGDGQPIALQRAWLPARLFPGAEGLDLASGSLYAQLESRYGVSPTHGEEVFTIQHIDGEDAAHLEVAPGTATFRLDKVSFSGEVPIEKLEAFLRADRYRISLRIGATTD